jgi:hypothetical protein
MRPRRVAWAVTVTGRVWGTGIGIACSATTEVTPSRSTSCPTAATKRSQA